MVYANDVWAQLPVKDLYDSQMMLASVEAAKDMYEKGAKAMDDFYKTYGDFQSPFSKDMEEYADMINRPVSIVNKLYESGIDPLRSAEGRAAVQQAIREFSIPKYNQMKSNAALGYEYLKSISALEEAGKFDLDREVWELKRRGIIPQDMQVNDKNQLLGYFSSVGNDGKFQQWGKMAGTPNKSAHDIFIPLVDDLNPHDISNEDALSEFGLKSIPGYYWTDAITPTDIRNTLALNIPGISNTADYQYLLHRVGGDYNKLLDLGVNSVREIIRQPKRAEDKEYWKKKDYQHDYAMENLRFRNNMRLKGGQGDSDKNPKEATSYGQTLLMRGISNWSGSSDPGANGLEIAKGFANRVANAYTNINEYDNAFVNFYSMDNAESTVSWRARFDGDSSRTADAATGGVNYIPQQDNKRLYTLNEMTSSTLYYPTGQMGKSKKNIPADASMVPTGKIYTAPMRDGTYSQFVEVSVGNENGSNTYYYKIAETEPSPVEAGTSYHAQWSPQSGSDQTFAPMGYSIIPSNRTRNTWTIMDAALNKAAGLGAGEVKAGQGYYLDY